MKKIFIIGLILVFSILKDQDEILAETNYQPNLTVDEVVKRLESPGDVAGAYASCDRAKNLIGWEAQYSIEDGIRDAFRWDEIRETILNYN